MNKGLISLENFYSYLESFICINSIGFSFIFANLRSFFCMQGLINFMLTFYPSLYEKMSFFRLIPIFAFITTPGSHTKFFFSTYLNCIRKIPFFFFFVSHLRFLFILTLIRFNCIWDIISLEAVVCSKNDHHC